MAEFVEAVSQFKRMCMHSKCRECLFNKYSNCDGYALEYPKDAEEIIMNWAKEHPESDSIFLLSKEELEKYKDVIPECNTYWWLRSPCDYNKFAAFVVGSGWAYDVGILVNNASVGIRPALRIDTSGKDVGEKISVNTYSFTVIDEGLVIATVPISFGMFDAEGNEYQKSEVRKWLLEWYEDAKGELDDKD